MPTGRVVSVRLYHVIEAELAVTVRHFLASLAAAARSLRYKPPEK